jgi:ribosomal protein L5
MSRIGKLPVQIPTGVQVTVDDKNPRIHGIEATFVTTARTDEEAYALLKEFGFPFKKHNK